MPLFVLSKTISFPLSKLRERFLRALLPRVLLLSELFQQDLSQRCSQYDRFRAAHSEELLLGYLVLRPNFLCPRCLLSA